MIGCSNPDCEFYPYYGMAPHRHVGVTEDPASIFGSTRVDPKETWPANFEPDPEAEGCGTWHCPECMRRLSTPATSPKEDDNKG